MRPRCFAFAYKTLSLIALLIGSVSLFAAGPTPVATYHYDNNRTGWQSNETALTPTNVKSSSFGLLVSVKLDDQVDAQPLFVPGVNITSGSSKGVHDVIYIASEGNTVYAIDAEAGTVLLTVNLGTPVPFPLGCGNNGPNVGVNSTPVIDVTASTLYVMAYTQEASGPAYHLHALDLGSLADKVSPQLVVASHKLSDGSTFNFSATYQRQRAALLLANGNVYAGFASFCDFAADKSRGWLLGWQTNSLTPLPANQLLNTQPNSPDNFFLASIWMSGYGLAADDGGNLIFVTGNSDYSGGTYDGVTNIQESVVKVSPDLMLVLDLFTPKNVNILDATDADFGSGGAMVLPDQPGSTPHLVVAAGKVGTMFLMNGDSLGGFSSSKNNVLGQYAIGECWCGQSYYVDPSDNIGRVVSSGGTSVIAWKVQTSGTPSLAKVSNSPSIGGGQDGGFFTTISSNGTANPVIWTVSRPDPSVSVTIYLTAFDPSSGRTMKQLFRAPAGSWPNVGGNSNLVPMVANGRVYVASNKQLRIFGLKSSKAKK